MFICLLRYKISDILKFCCPTTTRMIDHCAVFFCSLQDTQCLTKPNILLEKYFETDPHENFVIPAHHPSPTTSVPPINSRAAPASSIAVDINNEQQKPKNTCLHAFKWRNIEKKLRFSSKKRLNKKPQQPTTSSSATACAAATVPSIPAPSLTITIPEPLQPHLAPLESPSERVIRVATTAINTLGRAFTSCLPLSSFTLSETSPVPENFSTSPTATISHRVSSQLAILKSKLKTIKDSSLRNTNTQPSSKTTQTSSSNFLFSNTTVDDMVDKMMATINNATGRNKYKGPKVVKKMWKSASRWVSSGF